MKANLQELLKDITQRKDSETLRSKIESQRNELDELRRTLQEYQTHLNSQKKINMNRENANLDLNTETKKMDKMFNDASNERLAQTKKLIKIDEEIFLVQDEIKKKTEEYNSKYEALEKGPLPDKNALFLEIVKDFGVEFVEKDERRILIKNRNKKEIESLVLTEEPSKLQEKIWDLIL